MANLAQVLADAFRHEAGLARFVLAKIEKDQLEFIPSEGMKPLRDLANHLAQIPRLDISFFTKEIENIEQAQEMEKKLTRESLDEILEVFDQGVEFLTSHFKGMKDDEFLKECLNPCYSQGPDRSWAYYLPEITSHMVMHKMQLWMYLKLAGSNVNMMTYYGMDISG
jgi:uncharacterized damage-inducible protein DinB